MVEAVKRGFPQREIADAAFRYQQELEAGVRKVVGVNAYTEGDDLGPRRSCGSTRRSRASRSAASRRSGSGATPTRSERALDALDRRPRATRSENLMPLLLEAARADVTEGEIVKALQTVFGSYREAPVF